VPGANPTVFGSSTSVINYRAFNILTSGYGDITVTSASPIASTYSLIVGTNPKPAAINQWFVTPSTYKITDDFNVSNGTKLFTITATPKPGYQNPT
jgi:hypothetical protein